uniref:Uncharacterized protein n=1 Tax=Anguilla anguilla TaxID=7936 RepID=A0A0E9V455_ANGAN
MTSRCAPHIPFLCSLLMAAAILVLKPPSTPPVHC